MVWRGFCLPGEGGRPRRAHGISGQILGKLPLHLANSGHGNAGQAHRNPESRPPLKPAQPTAPATFWQSGTLGPKRVRAPPALRAMSLSVSQEAAIDSACPTPRWAAACARHS